MELGTRYPTLGFYTGGAGQADDGIPPQPFETFCYDSALLQAKIQDFNVPPDLHARYYQTIRVVTQMYKAPH